MAREKKKRNCSERGRLVNQPQAKTRERRYAVEGKGAKSLLILVKGDPISKNVERDAKRARFSGQIVKFSEEQAREQHTPLPLLIKEGELPVGPDALIKYFRASP
jgi:hypothetical protein